MLYKHVVPIALFCVCQTCLCHEKLHGGFSFTMRSRSGPSKRPTLLGYVPRSACQPPESSKCRSPDIEPLEALAIFLLSSYSATALTAALPRARLSRKSRLALPFLFMQDREASSRKQIHEFIHLWEAGRCDKQAKDELREILARGPLCGRLIHASPNGFRYLNSCAWKRFSFVFGQESLETFLGKSAREIADQLEIPPKTIKQQLQYGHTYKMVLFAGGAHFDCVQADWDGVEYMVRKYYPEVSDKVIPKLPEIRNKTMAEIQQMADYDMREAASTRANWGREINDFDDTVVGVRQWLWDHVGLGRDFTGDGKTRGRRGTPEYFAVNRPLVDLPGYVLIDLEM